MTDREMLKQALIVLKWIRERGHESGVIPCPKDHAYYIEPMRYAARDVVERIEKHITPNDQYSPAGTDPWTGQAGDGFADTRIPPNGESSDGATHQKGTNT